MLVDAVQDADGLEDVESAEGEEGDAFIALLAPEGDGLGDEEQAVDDQAEAEKDGDDLLHRVHDWLNVAVLGVVGVGGENSRRSFDCAQDGGSYSR